MTLALKKRSSLKCSRFKIKHSAYCKDDEKDQAEQGEFVPESHGFSPPLPPAEKVFSGLVPLGLVAAPRLGGVRDAAPTLIERKQ